MTWAQIHGGTTHFPFALLLCSAAFDALGFIFAGRQFVRDAHAVGYWTMIAAAAGSVGAVISGLVMTKGSVLGHGALRAHHLFVWPAFALLIGLATWRIIVGRRVTRAMLGGYIVGVFAAAALMSAAAYWGGEMMLRA